MKTGTQLTLALSLVLCALMLAIPASAHCGGCGSGGEKDHPHDIVDTAIAAGDFKTLVKAVQAAGMVDALKQPGPLTVFAPSDKAFAKLPKGTLEGLLKDKAKLRAVLSYHVVAGNVDAKAAARAGSAKTLSGKTVTFTKTRGGLKVENATVVSADVGAKNGVIHVIDTVLIPPAK